MSDPADEWLRADAKRRGMSIPAYEQEFGIIFADGPTDQRTRYHELGAGLMTSDDDLALAVRHEKRRLAHRPRDGRRTRSRIAKRVPA